MNRTTNDDVAGVIRTADEDGNGGFLIDLARDLADARSQVDILTHALDEERRRAEQMHAALVAADLLAAAACNLDHFEIDDPDGPELVPALDAYFAARERTR